MMMAFIGGITSFSGPIYGAATLTGLDELITAYTERVVLLTGTLFILVVLFAPLVPSGLLNHARANWLPSLFAQHTAEKTS